MTEQEFEFAGDISPAQATPALSTGSDGTDAPDDMTMVRDAEDNGDCRQFEEALAALETIVREMESGQLSLAASMKKFEEGTKLANFCTARLAETEKKVELLLKVSDQPEWAPIDDE